MNWLMPISASCWRTSSASAFDSEAMITEISTAASQRHGHAAEPAGEPRARRVARSRARSSVCTTVVTAW